MKFQIDYQCGEFYDGNTVVEANTEEEARELFLEYHDNGEQYQILNIKPE